MARAIHRLTARQAETLSKPGRHADGGNLYLAITPTGGKRWTFLFRWRGKPREMGLGPAAKGQVSLADARDRAAAARKLLNAGIDPLSAKNKRSGRAVPTFGQCADEYIKTHRPKYRNAEHARQCNLR